MTWRNIECEERDALLCDDKGVGSEWVATESDGSDEFGLPIVATTWATPDEGLPMLIDIRFPGKGHDRAPCQHHVWDPR